MKPSPRRCPRALSLLLGMLLLPAATTAEDSPVVFPVVRDGRPVARILLAGDNVHVRAAVNELLRCVERITGAVLVLEEGSRDLAGPTLHVGPTEYSPLLEEARSGVRVDGYLLARVGEDLAIQGALPQGTSNGIWSVLQDHFGVRWYHEGPLWEVLPERKSLEIRFQTGAGDRWLVENPSFLGRFYWGGSPSQSFARRMRLTQPGTPLPYVGAGHALNRVVPLEEYAASHPDYFAWIDGRRVTDRVSHPCFTHPDMFDVFMKHVRGGGSNFGVNDNRDACHCKRCLEIDGPSSRYLGMWNFSESYFQLMARVAGQTAREFPGRRLGLFAYQQTNSPPITVESIGDNVDVVLCQDTSQHFDPEVQRTDFRMSEEWARKAGGVSLYDYYGINYWTPRCFPSLLEKQLKHLHRAGVIGYMTHATTMSDSAMPMFYVYCRLLWDVDLDARSLIEEMLRDLYREARGPVREFYAHWEDCWLRQKKGRWFKGMDDFRGEMTIYSPADIEKGRVLLEEALTLAERPEVRQRIEYLRASYAFTVEAAGVHARSQEAVECRPPSSSAAARELSTAVVDAWQAFAEQLARSEKLPGSSASGWHPKTFRVRAWALKQQVRDAVLAPLVKWAVHAEGTIDPQELRATEKELARFALRKREIVEGLVTDSVGAVRVPPRAAPLQVADIPRLSKPPEPVAGPDDWTEIGAISGPNWVFRQAPGDREAGKYDEPMPQDLVSAPEPTDLSVSWQGAWDERHLYLRIVVMDDEHRQSQPDPALWKEDSVEIFLTPERARFDYPEHSWYFLMGGLRDADTRLVVGLRDGRALAHFRKAPVFQAGVDPSSLLRVAAVRHGTRTVYELALDWRLLPQFLPGSETSFGMALLVVDVDEAGRRTAEYGGGVLPRRRPSEFAALRLVEGPPRRSAVRKED